MVDRRQEHSRLHRSHRGMDISLSEPSSCSRGPDFWGLLTYGTTVNLYFRFAFPVECWRFQ